MLIVVHTYDVDGVCDDPRGAETSQGAFDKGFGVSVCDPESMLGEPSHERFTVPYAACSSKAAHIRPDALASVASLLPFVIVSAIR